MKTPIGLLLIISRDSHLDTKRRRLLLFLFHVGTHHHSIISFGSDDTANTLCCLAHRIKGQKVTLLNLKHLAHVLQSGPAVHVSFASNDREGESLGYKAGKIVFDADHLV